MEKNWEGDNRGKKQEKEKREANHWNPAEVSTIPIILKADVKQSCPEIQGT
jgi:hypothetical protein